MDETEKEGDGQKRTTRRRWRVGPADPPDRNSGLWSREAGEQTSGIRGLSSEEDRATTHLIYLLNTTLLTNRPTSAQRNPAGTANGQRQRVDGRCTGGSVRAEERE